MTRPSIIDLDMTDRIKEIRRTEGRQPIKVAGPAGNPTQPPEDYSHAAIQGVPRFGNEICPHGWQHWCSDGCGPLLDGRKPIAGQPLYGPAAANQALSAQGEFCPHGFQRGYQCWCNSCGPLFETTEKFPGQSSIIKRQLQDAQQAFSEWTNYEPAPSTDWQEASQRLGPMPPNPSVLLASQWERLQRKDRQEPQ